MANQPRATSKLQRAIERRWYGVPGWLWLLLPLELLFRALSNLRRIKQSRDGLNIAKPVIIVGNISVGGTGKTPVLIALVKQLRKHGIRAGVISRGYGREGHLPVCVNGSSTVSMVGDEPLEIYKATGALVMVASERVVAAQSLGKSAYCDVILSDDGLQHYKLPRHREIVVVDSVKGFGNGHCLPVGPLREPISRIKQVDWVLVNGGEPSSETKTYGFRVVPVAFENVLTGQIHALSLLTSLKSCIAIAGLGNPGKFFTSLQQVIDVHNRSLALQTRAFPDHHAFTSDDLTFARETPVIMTAKDAVKCKSFAKDNWWALKVEAKLPDEFVEILANDISTITATITAMESL